MTDILEKTKMARGLSDEEAARSREKYGSNVITLAKRKSFWSRFVSNLNDPIIKILIIALIVNLLFVIKTSNWVETAGIAISVFLASFISTLSEHGSEGAFARLNEENENYFCRVRRNGAVRKIQVSDIVCGDIVLLSSGDKIPADGFMVCGRLTVDQSTMTGESAEIEKVPRRGEKLSPKSASALLRGCSVISGEGEFEVAVVGDKTFIGEISNEIKLDTRESPLKIRLSRLAKQISRLGYAAAVLIGLVYLINAVVLDSGMDRRIILMKLCDVRFMLGSLLNAFTLGLTVVVVTVPEGLPLMISVVLSSNIKKMVRDKVLVKKPVGIEAAGSMNILFTDKTGTLTEGVLSVTSIFTDRESYFNLAEFRSAMPKSFELYRFNALYNTSCELEGREVIGGNSTEKALASSLLKSDIKKERRLLEKAPFDSDKKFSSAVVALDKPTAFYKGAPEKLLPMISYSIGKNGEKRSLDRAKFLTKMGEHTRRGERVILCAVGDKSYGERCELSLVCGIVLSDRIRNEARASVESLRQAGIQVVMITGDNKDTASSIAEKCGILGKECDICLTSDKLSKMSDKEVADIIPRLAVVARALPKDKSRLVRIAQEMGLVCGMTGDGINDAPALKCADIGFSMGNGTQVAKEAGDIVILDNNLASIVRAVLYGRTIFKSIRKFIVLQLTINLCAVGVTMICPFIGIDSPVTVVQMLWLNIIMDTLGGLAFAGEPPLDSYMKEPPKRRDEPILNGYMVNQILTLGLFTVALSLAFLKHPFFTSHFRSAEDNICLLTAFFAFFIFAAVFNCFNARSERINLLAGISRNRPFSFIMLAISVIQIVFVYLGGSVLRTVPLYLAELKTALLAATLVFPVEFVRKLYWKHVVKKSKY